LARRSCYRADGEHGEGGAESDHAGSVHVRVRGANSCSSLW
jgi:hypothetical protein